MLYCFVCYLFKDNNKFSGGDAFVNEGLEIGMLKLDCLSMLVLLIVLIVKLRRNIIYF
ncbi:hypothetical protein Zm00014a_023832 [Zea mays]|jgi:hypothetical protein|uniref:Uncharacterized protein n=1 Tax=Zea mays TaxID=4577 RepID=A0A3L6E833_MAIZE|nr:hypothetical protein Zm00014a_023832 [Zea mays]